ncbi:MAG: hypothetical protein KIT45_07220 [Fimbriimonadia bacterium]|nr:hypothetical protein [Fimbriimonadia bacterium]
MKSSVVREQNRIEVPDEWAKQLGITTGNQVYLYHLGDTISIRAKPSKLLDACEEFEAIMVEEGVDLQELLGGLAQERENS